MDEDERQAMTDEDNMTRLERAEETDRWTIGALKDHLEKTMASQWKLTEALFKAQETATSAALAAAEKAVEAALVAQEKAVLKAEQLATARDHQTDVWKKTVIDRVELAMPRSEYTPAHDALVKGQDDLATRLDKGAGHDAGVKATFYGLAALIASVVAVVSIMFQFTR